MPLICAAANIRELDDNKAYMTKDGQYFKVRCAAQNKNSYKVALASTKAYDFGECLQFCAVSQGCARSVCTVTG